MSGSFLNRFHRYKLRAGINHKDSHFTATLIDRTDQLYVFDDQIGIRAVRRSTGQMDAAIYSSVEEI
jgi:hypothetical protein